MENVKYFLQNGREVSKEELEKLRQEFHQQNPDWPFEYSTRDSEGGHSKAEAYANPDAWIKWEAQLHQLGKLNKLREEGRCLVCGARHCPHHNKKIHR